MGLEKHRLLNEDDYDDHEEEEENKKMKCRKIDFFYLFLIFFLLFLLLLLLTVLFINANYQYDDHYSDIYKGLPKNHSELIMLNENLCTTVTANNWSVGQNANNLDKIFIVKGEQNLTDEQACGIESILRLFPDKNIYLIDFNKKEHTSYDKFTPTPNYLGLLLCLYKDRLQLIMTDKQQYFSNTPLSSFAKCKDNFEFLALLITAYKYGGFVSTSDVVTTSRHVMDSFPDETIVEPFAIFTTEKCDEFLYYVMQLFNSSVHVKNPTLDTLLTDSIALYKQSMSEVESRRGSVNRMGHSEISYNPQEPTGSFLKLGKFRHDDELWMANLDQYCRQVVQAYLGIKVKTMEAEEETRRIRSAIARNKVP